MFNRKEHLAKIAAKARKYFPGQTINGVFYVKDLYVNKRSVRYCEFLCPKCNKIYVTDIVSVVRGASKSCGCAPVWNGANIPTYTTHGMTGTLTHNSWEKMKSRCFNKNHHYYHKYGGAGITVYEPWINDFMAFYNYIGERPSVKHTVDRWPNKKGNYEPGNVRWATPKQQQRNLSTNIMVFYRGKEITLIEACEMAKIKRTRVIERKKRVGISYQESFDHYNAVNGNFIPHSFGVIAA